MRRVWLASVILAFAHITSATSLAKINLRVIVGVSEAIPLVDVYAPMTIEGFRVSRLIYEPLAQVDVRTGTLEPWLAIRWTIGRTGLRVHLRRNVRVHDGTELTAAMVVAAFDGFRDPANKAATWLPLFEGVARARVIARYEVEFAIDRPTFASMRNLLTGLRVSPGTGPYRLGRIEGGRVELTRVDGWWRGATPKFDLIYKAVADQTLARQMIARGELDYAVGRGADSVAVAGGTGTWIDLNLKRPVFRDVNVRRALLRAWDRATAARTLFDGEPKPALDAFEPSLAHYPPGSPVGTDVKAAAAVFESVKPPLKFDVLVVDAAEERWLGLYQNDLRKLGVTMTITRVARDGGWYARLKDGAFDAAVGGGPLLTTVDPAAWSSGAAYNTLGFADAKVDTGLKALDHEFDPVRRARGERALIARIRELIPQLPGLTWTKGARLTSPRLRIDPAHPDDVWRWRLQD